MNLMKGITGYRGLRERKRGEDWERIWRGLGDKKQSTPGKRKYFYRQPRERKINSRERI